MRDVPAPAARAGEVVLDVIAGGICGTDLHIVADEFPYWPPVVLGHEILGRVAEVGAGVDEALIGKRVVAEPHAGACGVCYLCRRGWAQLCADKRSPGWGIDGGFAERVRLPAHLLHVIADAVPDDAAVLAEPLAVVCSGYEQAPVEPGDLVVVVGAGPLGLLAALAATAYGAAGVLVVGRHSSQLRLAAAAEHGLAVARSPDEAASWVAARSDRGGADLVVDTTGAASAVAMATALLRRRGRLLALGFGGAETIAVPWDAMLQRAVTVSFAMSSSHTGWLAATELLSSRRIAPEWLVTPFDLAAWSEAFDAVEGRHVIKAVLRP
nr:alcohol dehydrogenase catalytic domain-containing protein [Planosporangium thailandense]